MSTKTKIRHFETRETARMLGLRPEQLKKMVDLGYIDPIHATPGTGRSNEFDFREILRAAVMCMLATIHIPKRAGAELGQNVAEAFDPEWLEPGAELAWLVVKNGDEWEIVRGPKVETTADNELAIILPLTRLARGLTTLKFTPDGDAI